MQTLKTEWAKFSDTTLRLNGIEQRYFKQ